MLFSTLSKKATKSQYTCTYYYLMYFVEVELPTLYSVWWSFDLLLIDVQGLSKNKKNILLSRNITNV